MIRTAINGYGRIGRVAHRVVLEKHSDKLQIVAINAGSSTDLKGWMYLIKFDSSYGTLNNHTFSIIKPEDKPLPFETTSKFLGHLVIDEIEIPIFSDRDPLNLPWKDLNVDVVIESTGAFTKAEDLQKHIQAGAKSVVLSAPFKGETHVDTFVLGVNFSKDEQGTPSTIVSNASCTTNCISPVAKIIETSIGIEKAMMTTIHGYTSDQKLHDGGHRDYRRARAAAENIVPTSTGATIAAAEAIPELKGIFNGLSIRVPVPVGSLSDFTFLTKRETSIEEVNSLFKQAAEQENWKGILAVTNEPIVSSDIVGNSHSSIVDLSLTQVVGGNMVKIIAWYDNEYGYANRLVEETIIVGNRPQSAT
jgi:glyceraldehyde 3-phosphate dehydrogenase